MELDFNSEKPIFQQIAEGVEDAILAGAFPEESQIPSITEFAVRYTINPATALKGINLLAEEGVVYKKRGVGMFVSQGAVERLREKRQQGFYRRFVVPLAEEAARLGLPETEVQTMVAQAFSGKDSGLEQKLGPGDDSPSLQEEGSSQNEHYR